MARSALAAVAAMDAAAIRSPIKIDYDNESVDAIVEKIEYAIEQHPSFLKVIPPKELEVEETLNKERKWEY